MRKDILIATRIVRNAHQRADAQFERLTRQPSGSFVLKMGSDEPGDSGIELSLSLAEVFEWFQDSPEQIKRAVILGGKYQSETSRNRPSSRAGRAKT